MLETFGVGGVTDVWMSQVSNGTNIVVQIRKQYRGHAQQIANALWGSSAGQWFFKNVMVVEEDIEAVARVLRGDWLTTGPAVRQFEADLSALAGGVAAVAVTSGTAALHASGFAAVYVTALWLGNAELPHRTSTRHRPTRAAAAPNRAS